MRMESVDMTAQNIEKIGELFPNCITEMLDEEKSTPEEKVYKKVINFELLKQMLSSNVLDGDEAYEFTWVGKKAAIVEANKPIRKTLRPCKEESVDWDNTENLYIEGDNLEILKLLQESYLNKVKMIYIDPPYNTGNDFIYNDDFKMTSEEYAEETREWDEDGNRMFKNTNINGRFHSDWCSMIYSRLVLARNLLSENGVIFISIDDNEMSNLIKICDEIFGSDNFQGMFVINASPSAIDYGCIAKMHEYAVMYSKNSSLVQCYQLTEEDKKFDYKDELGEFIIYPLYNGNVAFNPQTRPNLFYPFYLNPNHMLDENFYEIGLEKKEGFQICTLKQSSSEIRKRQEVGRGMRLCVNEDGDRMDENALGADVHNINVLTVIASESYDKFAKGLQAEIAEAVGNRPRQVTEILFENARVHDKNGNEETIDDSMARRLIHYMIKMDYIDENDALTDKFYEDKANGEVSFGTEMDQYKPDLMLIIDSIYDDTKMKPENARSNNVELKVDPDKLAMPEFKALWSKINARTAYVVDFDTDELVRKSIVALGQ